MTSKCKTIGLQNFTTLFEWSHVSLTCRRLNKTDNARTNNVTLRRFCATIVAVEKQ